MSKELIKRFKEIVKLIKKERVYDMIQVTSPEAIFKAEDGLAKLILDIENRPDGNLVNFTNADSTADTSDWDNTTSTKDTMEKLQKR